MKTKTSLVIAALAIALNQATVVEALAGPGPRDPLPRRPVLKPAAERFVASTNPKVTAYTPIRPTSRALRPESRNTQPGLYATTARKFTIKS